MKKAIFISLLVLLFIPALAFCEEKSPATDTSMDMSKGMDMGKGMEMGKAMGMMGQGMNCNCGRMCMMMQKQMVATSDGGVIVLSGHKLYKYDKNLQLVKEAEIKMEMPRMMGQMKEKCDKAKQKE